MRVSANGIELEVEVRGEDTAPAIVLMRGLGTQLIDWPETFVAALKKAGLRVVVFDNRDVGLSQKFEGILDIGNVAKGIEIPPYNLNDMAADVVGILDALDIHQAHLFAISMGGMIGQVIAAEHGDRLKTFFSVMSSSGKSGLPGPTPEAAATLSAKTSPDATEAEIIQATAEGLRVCGSPGYPLSEEERLAIGRARYQRDYSPGGINRQMAAVVANGDRTELLKTITVPTLVIHGADDPLIPVAAGEDTAAQIPGAELKVISGMGHDLPPALMPEMTHIVCDFIHRNT
ncbi:MAG: alpha/beta fold hydrolase [Pseudomonadales bacterium]|nr:alpha/beta fold hydrolase [Pseudomonadales bacterium]MBO6595547.1 alpha/beta fold hydrolase [Pseudomonadales bacterium]MBO6658087.1 alpha/beta fold hydrolase [Pseudomonadales bacterium]MBO6702046.1 alpha/beta fold hydrolase [Pseudomonadales bacterium]MBO6820895.1 alpha/beta fold hydrolase [Pseudomonadales bacterium]